MMDKPHPLDPDSAESNQVSAIYDCGGDPSEDTGMARAVVASDSFRFGMKSLALVIILPAIVLATISYFGTLLGLLASLGLSCLALGVLLFIGIVFHRKMRSTMMRQVDLWVILFSLLALGLFFGVAFAGGSQAAVYFLSDLKLAQKYNEKLGFTHDAEMNMFQGNYLQTIRVKSVSPGGEFEKAGFLPGDVIVDYDAKEFFRELEKSQGQPVTVSVATGVSGSTMTDLSKNTQRSLTVSVPPGN